MCVCLRVRVCVYVYLAQVVAALDDKGVCVCVCVCVLVCVYVYLAQVVAALDDKSLEPPRRLCGKVHDLGRLGVGMYFVQFSLD